MSGGTDGGGGDLGGTSPAMGWRVAGEAQGTPAA